MKIASFSTNGYPSASRKYLSIFTHEQAKALITNGAEVEIFDLAPNAKEFPENTTDNYEGVTVHRVHPIHINKPLRAFKSISFLKEKTISQKFDTILCSFLDSQYFKYLPWFMDKRLHTLAFTVHGRDAMIPYGGVKGFIKTRIKRYLFNLSDYCFPVSEYTETLLSCLIQRNEINSTKIKLIYNGLNDKKFSSALNLDKKNLRKKLNINQDYFILLTVCQLIKRKGVNLVVEGVLRALEENSKIIHIIIGEGPEKEAIQNLINEKQFKDNFIFLSNLSDNDLAQYYAAADVYAMISKTNWENRATEGFGISYIEASYMGLPVICGKEGGGITAVQNNFTGFWMDPRDINCNQNIADKILYLINNPNEYERLSVNGKQYSRSLFSWNLNANRLISHLNRN